jgi:dienelactone hydrolase
VPQQFRHLGDFSDWVAAAPVRSDEVPDLLLVRQLVDTVLLGSPRSRRSAWDDETPRSVRVDRQWTADGLCGEEVSWSAGFGPRTTAWVLKPSGATGTLPGVLALHGHDGFKYYGKEKVADGPDPTPAVLTALRDGYYGGRAFANDLARAGYVVVVHDAFGWGSRRFPIEQMPRVVRRLGELTAGTVPPDVVPGEVPPTIAVYNAAAWHHENVLEKYCRMLGTTFAAVVAREDRVAANYLLSRDDVGPAIGSIGLSGGGCRSALLRATCPRLSAAVVVGMMSTYDALIDHNVVDHTWMLLPGEFAAHADWPDLASVAAPGQLLVQYNLDDPLFPAAGASAAHERITAHYAAAGDPAGYRGEFYDGPHKFDIDMQHAAFAWLAQRLR